MSHTWDSRNTRPPIREMELHGYRTASLQAEISLGVLQTGSASRASSVALTTGVTSFGVALGTQLGRRRLHPFTTLDHMLNSGQGLHSHIGFVVVTGVTVVSAPKGSFHTGVTVVAAPNGRRT